MSKANDIELRKFSLDDAKFLFEMGKDKLVQQYLCGACCRTMEKAIELAECYSNGDFKHDFYWAITLDNKIIGVIILVQFMTPYLDCSYYISKPYRNQGIAENSMKKAILWLKNNDTNHTGIDLIIENDNSASKKVATKLGAKFFNKDTIDGKIQCHYRIDLTEEN